MNICILRLGTVVSTRIDNEAVVRMNVPCAKSVFLSVCGAYSPRLTSPYLLHDTRFPIPR